MNFLKNKKVEKFLQILMVITMLFALAVLVRKGLVSINRFEAVPYTISHVPKTSIESKTDLSKDIVITPKPYTRPSPTAKKIIKIPSNGKSMLPVKVEYNTSTSISTNPAIKPISLENGVLLYPHPVFPSESILRIKDAFQKWNTMDSNYLSFRHESGDESWYISDYYMDLKNKKNYVQSYHQPTPNYVFEQILNSGKVYTIMQDGKIYDKSLEINNIGFYNNDVLGNIAVNYWSMINSSQVANQTLYGRYTYELLDNNYTRFSIELNINSGISNSSSNTLFTNLIDIIAKPVYAETQQNYTYPLNVSIILDQNNQVYEINLANERYYNFEFGNTNIPKIIESKIKKYNLN